MWEDYKAERKAKGESRGGSGFGGRGFKFNQAETLKKKQMMMLTIKAHRDEDNESGEEDDLYKEREMELHNEIENEVHALMGDRAPKNTMAPAGLEAGGTSSLTGLSESITVAPAAPADAAAVAAAAAQGGANSAADMVSAIFGGAPGAANVTSKAAQAAAKAMELAKKYNLAKAGPSPAQKVAAAAEAEGHFEDELEINDFPAQARWRVTRKEHVEEIIEFSGAAVTVRGTFYPPGAKVKKGGERKLYLFLEAKTESCIRKAKAHIRSILEDQLRIDKTTFAPQGRLQGPGRYQVLAITGNK